MSWITTHALTITQPAWVAFALCLMVPAAFGQGDAAASTPRVPAVPQPTQQDAVEVWVDLSAPAIANLAQASVEQRNRLRQHIGQQQDAVMQQLASLGGVELARVQLVRNALAVRLPRSALAQAREVPGVRSILPVRHVLRDPVPSPRVPELTPR